MDSSSLSHTPHRDKDTYSKRMAFQPWTVEEENTLLEEYTVKKLDLPTIARQHHRSVKAIRMRLVSIVNRYKQSHPTMTTMECLASAFGRSVQDMKDLFETEMIVAPSLSTSKPSVESLLGMLEEIQRRLDRLEKRVRKLKK